MRISDWSSDVCSSDLIAAETGNQDRSSIYEGAFMEHDERAKLSPVDETEQLEMPDPEQDRKSVVEGKSVSVRVDLGGRRFIIKQHKVKSFSVNGYSSCN